MNSLRLLIREILKEQVVGYTPLSKKSDDDSGYIEFGDLSAPSSQKTSETENPEDQEQLSAQEQQMTQQRQQDIDKKDAVAANYDGRQLQRLRKATG